MFELSYTLSAILPPQSQRNNIKTTLHKVYLKPDLKSIARV